MSIGIATQPGQFAAAAAGGGGGYDADAQAYFDALATAGSSISTPNKSAVDDLVRGLKTDGTWASIVALVLFAGPDDLTGALVPLKGTAPTNSGFSSADHSRTGGLTKTTSSSKTLDTNYNNDDFTKDDFHYATYVTTVPSSNVYFFWGGVYSSFELFSTRYRTNCQDGGTTTIGPVGSVGFCGVSRSGAASYDRILGGAADVASTASTAPTSASLTLFPSWNVTTNGRLGFYSLGSALDLSAYEARIATYLSAIS